MIRGLYQILLTRLIAYSAISDIIRESGKSNLRNQFKICGICDSVFLPLMVNSLITNEISSKHEKPIPTNSISNKYGILFNH